MLMSKYGRDYSLDVLENTDGCVSTRVSPIFEFRSCNAHAHPRMSSDHVETRHRPAARGPSRCLCVEGVGFPVVFMLILFVSSDLHEIAKAYAVDWKPENYVEPEAPSVSETFF